MGPTQKPGPEERFFIGVSNGLMVTATALSTIGAIVKCYQGMALDASLFIFIGMVLVLGIISNSRDEKEGGETDGEKTTKVSGDDRGKK